MKEIPSEIRGAPPMKKPLLNTIKYIPMHLPIHRTRQKMATVEVFLNLNWQANERR